MKKLLITALMAATIINTPVIALGNQVINTVVNGEEMAFENSSLLIDATSFVPLLEFADAIFHDDDYTFLPTNVDGRYILDFHAPSIGTTAKIGYRFEINANTNLVILNGIHAVELSQSPTYIDGVMYVPVELFTITDVTSGEINFQLNMMEIGWDEEPAILNIQMLPMTNYRRPIHSDIIIEPIEANFLAQERNAFELMNIHRMAQDLPPYIWDDTLHQAARVHSKDLVDTGILSHTGSDGSGPTERVQAINPSHNAGVIESIHVHGHFNEESGQTAFFLGRGYPHEIHSDGEGAHYSPIEGNAHFHPLNPTHTHAAVGIHSHGDITIVTLKVSQM